MVYIIVVTLLCLSAYCFWCAEQAKQPARFNGNMFQKPVKYEKVTAKNSYYKDFKEFISTPIYSIRQMVFIWFTIHTLYELAPFFWACAKILFTFLMHPGIIFSGCFSLTFLTIWSLISYGIRRNGSFQR